jgi:hypothetical protein
MLALLIALDDEFLAGDGQDMSRAKTGEDFDQGVW